MPKLSKMYIQHVLVLLAFITYTQQQAQDPAFKEQLKKVREDCAAQEGVDLAAAQKNWDENKFPNDNKLKCYYKCFNIKFGVLDESGEVVDDKLGELAAHFNDAATQKEIVEECGPLKGADLCETAYKLMACVKAAKLD